MEVKYPFQLDASGRTAGVGYDEHIRHMIEQVLFTSEGERVNRPTFGCGLMELVFENESLENQAYTRLIVNNSLNQWLAQRISIEDVSVIDADSQMIVRIIYTVTRTGHRQVAEFRRQRQ